jgi:hypothetical protein
MAQCLTIFGCRVEVGTLSPSQHNCARKTRGLLRKEWEMKIKTLPWLWWWWWYLTGESFLGNECWSVRRRETLEQMRQRYIDDTNKALNPRRR